jgi:ClpP class serine protease
MARDEAMKRGFDGIGLALMPDWGVTALDFDKCVGPNGVMPHEIVEIIGDTAIVPIWGVLLMAVPDWVKSLGIALTDANDVEEEIDTILADPNVAQIVLDVDSPGGDSFAGEKLFSMLEAAGRKKPLFAWVGDGCMMCSAAYHAGSSARAIFGGRWSDVGNVGTYVAMLDDSEFWKALGVNWEIIKSGEFKAMGMHTPLSEPQRAWLQEMVDQCAARFRADVKKYRTGIADTDLQGQWFRGLDAATRGFLAGTAKDLPSAMAKMRRLR